MGGFRGFGGENVRLFPGRIWAFAGGFGLSWGGIRAFIGRIWAFVGKDSGVRGKRLRLSWGFGLSWRGFGFSWGFELSWGGIRDFTNLRLRAGL